jgi:TAT (twin-arginine translocation) pathway signal sequence
MQRRAFLKWSAAGAAAAGLPVWVGSCRTTPEAVGSWPGGTEGPVLDAFRVASQAGKPVLVLVVDQGGIWQWGAAWGQALTFGKNEFLADLALCEVVVAPMDEVRAALPGLPGLTGRPTGNWLEPVALLIETDEPSAIQIKGPVERRFRRIPVPAWDESEEPFEAAVRARVEDLERMVRAAVAPDRFTIERRAAQAARVLGLEVPADPLAHDELSESAPAVIRAAGEAFPERRKLAIDMLAGVAAMRLRWHAPRGAYWATSTGCGADIEDLPEDQRLGIACGMGHVPKISERFLYFHTQQS